MNRVKLFASCLGLSMVPAVGVAQEGCRVLTEVTKLPAVTALLDSAALVANLPAPNAGAPGEVVVSVMTGATPQVHVMDSVAAAAAGVAVQERVLASLKPGIRNAIPAFRVRVVLAQPTAVHIDPSVLCEPKATTPARQASLTYVTPAGPGAPQVRPQPRSVSPRIKIGSNGEVLQVDLGAGTGVPEADRSLRQALEGQRYQPALLDGRPVQVWLREKKIELVR